MPQCVLGVPDLTLSGQEDQHVSVAFPAQLADRVDDRLRLVAYDGLTLVVVVRLLDQRPVADLDRVGAPGDLDDRRVREVLREPLRVDRRGRDHDLQVRAPRQQLAQVAEDEVDVEAALVGLVDDQGVVAAQLLVVLELREQDAVGHQLDPARRRGLVGEPHLVSDRVAELGAQLLGDPLGHAARGDPARLRVPDQPATAATLPATQAQADLGQLGGLPGAGLAGDDHHLVVADRRRDVVPALGDRQLGREVELHGQECVRSQIVGGIAPSRASAPSDGAVATSVTT